MRFAISQSRAGRPFSLVDVELSHKRVRLGREILKKLKAEDDILDQTVLIKGQRFRVIGILEEKGAFFGDSQDN